MDQDQATTYGWQMGDPCPCGSPKCPTTKISYKTGHTRGCVCPRCIGRRNRAKGQAAQRKAHRALGGTGPTPTHEESARGYVVDYVGVMPEVKTGDQISRWLWKGLHSEWFRRALRQAEMARPEGFDGKPAVMLQFPGESDSWLVVKFARLPGQD